ncbi:Amino acid transporter, transmembrane domain [Dillenia turbinata]|uniref:Amino acid transporter, transmembrane domain n=1 Tax=Dillenia turbinata TaxID=194707 RepID=A0AAN8ZQ36_9MAGN
MVEARDPAVNFDEDGHPKREGTWLTASAHIITAVIGSGVLSLGWTMAQLGWIAGPASMLMFALITWFTSILVADSNKSPDPITGKRNYKYMDLVNANLGRAEVILCGLSQYGNLVGATIGYTLTSGISMAEVAKTNCFQKYGHDAECHISNNPYIIIFGCIQLILSQTPIFHKLSFLSILAAIMSFSYSSIAVALSISKIAEGNHARTSLTGLTVGVDVTSEEKVWKIFQALGNIAFAYAFSMVLVEIQASQDTIKSGPSKTKAMQKATTVAASITTIFYILSGVTGYAAFGNNAPGDILTGFESHKLFWIIIFANVCVVVHLIGAFQVFAQPFFQFVEKKCADKWPESGFIKATYPIHIPMFGNYDFSFFRLVWRSIYVIMATSVAVILPFFNDILGLLGAIVFWPLTVFIPIQIHIKQRMIPRFSFTWICFQILSLTCLTISLAAAAASVRGLVVSFKANRPFH